MIVVVGYFARPNVPTEQGVAWNWAVEYSKFDEVLLITKKGEEHYFEKAQLPENLKVQFVGPEISLDNPIGATSGLLLALSHSLWAIQAAALIKKTQNSFVHHTTISSVKFLTPLFFLREITIWGPVGGVQQGALSGVSLRTKIYEIYRRIFVFFLKYFYRLNRHRLARISVILVANSETLNFLNNFDLKNLKLENPDGVRQSRTKDFHSNIKVVQLLWAGRLVDFKRPDLAVETLRILEQFGIQAQLTFAGSGDKKVMTNLESMTTRYKLTEKVKFLGRVPQSELFSIMEQTDIVLSTSMRETSAPIVLEALNLGCHVVGIRTETIKSLFSAVEVSGPDPILCNENDIATELAKSIFNYINLETSERKNLWLKAQQRASKDFWDQKVIRVRNYVESEKQKSRRVD